MRPTTLLVAAWLALALVLVVSSPVQANFIERMRANFKLPTLFNFVQFKDKFNKRYGSLVEEICRRKIYLGRAVQVFVSLVNYSHFLCSSYLGVNERSDLTPRELRAAYRPASKLRPPEMAGSELHHLDEEESALEEVEEMPVAELEEIGEQLSLVERHGQEPGYRELAQELHKQVQAEVFTSSTSFGAPQDLSAETAPQSNNPQYAGHRRILKSERPTAASSLPANLMGLIYNLPGAGYVSTVLGDTASKVAGWLWGGAQQQQQQQQSPTTDAMKLEPPVKLPDEVWVDFRQSGCLTPVKNQGECGSCYAFAGIAYYEYLYCRMTGQQVSFSEQYIVSCGHRKEMGACEGGRMDLVSMFVDQFGLELARDFPYLVANGSCPYDEATPSLFMGYIKPERGGYKWLEMAKFDAYLERKVLDRLPANRPIMFGMGVSPNFDHYRGGVDDPAECLEEYGHAMLLVGHGREEGREYYLFRNSYGQNWGERGYYKLDKGAMRRCAAGYFGVVSKARFAAQHEANSNQLSALNRKRSRGEQEGPDQSSSAILEELARRQRARLSSN